MTDKWYYKEVHLNRDPPLPKGWFLTGHPSCARDVAVKFCPRWHKKGRESAKSREEIIFSAVTEDEIRSNAPIVSAIHRAMYKAKLDALLPKKKKIIK